jgi:uncharacterized protein involved in exopolysaccharide biosynthesis
LAGNNAAETNIQVLLRLRVAQCGSHLSNVNMNQSDKTSTGEGGWQGESIRLVDLWEALLQHKTTIVLATVLMTGLSVAAAFLMTPVYRADVLMAYVEQEDSGAGLNGLSSQYGGLASLVGVNLGQAGSKKDESIAVLGSRTFARQFMEEMDLMPLLFPDVNEKDDPPSRADAFRRFDEDIRLVTEDKQTGLITLTIDFRDRELATLWANTMIEMANSRIRQTAIDESTKSIEYLNRELARTREEELRQAIYRLVEGHIGKIMLANVHEQYAFRVIDPAEVSDEDAFVKPKRLLMIASGIVVGFFLGAFIVFFRHFGAVDIARK